MLDHWLRTLTFSGPFPIPCKWFNAEVLRGKPEDSGKGTLYCWTHVPLVEVPLRVLVELGHRPDVMVAHPGKIVDGECYVIPGLTTRLHSISSDRLLLLRVRTALRDGKSVVCTADREMFGPIMGDVLRVAGRAGARVVFAWAERMKDGTIKVFFREAPHPYCESAEAIGENVEFLRRANRCVFDELGVPERERIP